MDPSTRNTGSAVTYYNDLDAYGDGKALYVSARALHHFGLSDDDVEDFLGRPDLIVEHGRPIPEELRLWQRSRIRKRVLGSGMRDLYPELAEVFGYEPPEPEHDEDELDDEQMIANSIDLLRSLASDRGVSFASLLNEVILQQYGELECSTRAVPPATPPRDMHLVNLVRQRFGAAAMQ